MTAANPPKRPPYVPCHVATPPTITHRAGVLAAPTPVHTFSDLSRNRVPSLHVFPRQAAASLFLEGQHARPRLHDAHRPRIPSPASYPDYRSATTVAATYAGSKGRGSGAVERDGALTERLRTKVPVFGGFGLRRGQVHQRSRRLDLPVRERHRSSLLLCLWSTEAYFYFLSALSSPCHNLDQPSRGTASVHRARVSTIS